MFFTAGKCTDIEIDKVIGKCFTISPGDFVTQLNLLIVNSIL